ncbi:MAG: isochorismate synthase [Oscillatoriales cyanobacterium C42_A2020_001]|nr:isochorismate synthase [Leptolyngbyaceae cyanobacterium C42_A2020_001]
MVVTQYCNQRFQKQRDLYQFLLQCQRCLSEEKSSQLISLTFEIHSVDPLAIFNELAATNQLNFYFEKQETGKNYFAHPQRTAIAAIDSVVHFHSKGPQRFTQIKRFIQSTLSRIVVAGDLNSLFTGPTFFCNFTFQATSLHTVDSAFPGATCFLPKWQIACHNQTCTVVNNLILECTTHLPSTVDILWQTLQHIQAIQYNCFAPSMQHLELLSKQDVAPTNTFKQSVESALQSIQANVFNKIVLAHAVDVWSPLPFHSAYSLNNLRRLYPDCYVFSVNNGRGQSFVGASPERLVCVQNRQLVTDALAGSAPRGQTVREDAVQAQALLNSEKDNYEHQIVVDFITRQLTSLGLTPELSPLRLLQLSNIQHLHTPIRAMVPASVHLLDILAELHPTPAVAGMPREVTCEEICRYESFERSLYAAPIGWINHRGDGEFAVGIRSALIDGCRARLFAGAGIVAGSDPERELLEVQLKLQALLAALV